VSKPGSCYVSSDELAELEIPETTSWSNIRSACSTIDGFLGRPEGLVWLPDAAGVPAYMQGLSPRLTLTTSSSMAPGSAVTATFTGAVLDDNIVGEAVVLDRSNEDTREVCTVQSVSGDVITIKTVLNSHASGCTIDFGLTIKEEREVPRGRCVSRVSRFPVVRMIGGAGRYGLGRRSQQLVGGLDDFNLLATMATFGGAPIWESFDVAASSVSYETGEIWIPSGLLMACYTDVRMWYVAGWPKSQIPWNVKQAVANVLKQMKDTGLGANIRSRNVRDGTVVGRFENTFIDPDTRAMLSPYKSRNFG
jgi:hypothetical protein